MLRAARDTSTNVGFLMEHFNSVGHKWKKKHCVSIKVIAIKHVQEKKNIHFIQVQKVIEHIARKAPIIQQSRKSNQAH